MLLDALNINILFNRNSFVSFGIALVPFFIPIITHAESFSKNFEELSAQTESDDIMQK